MEDQIYYSLAEEDKMGWICLEGGRKNYKTSYRMKNCEEKTCRKTPNKMEGCSRKIP